MACKKCNDCNDNGCAPQIYPKCFIIDKTYGCLGLTPGKTGDDLLSALNTACAAWGGGSLTFNNGLTKTGNIVQLGGALVKNTLVDAGTAYSLTLGGQVLGATNIQYGFDLNPNGNGPGIPAVGVAMVDTTGTDVAAHTVTRVGGKLFAISQAVNGNNVATISLKDNGAVLKFSPDGGTTEIKVEATAAGINLDGKGLPSTCDQTQLQETLASIAAASTYPITTAANNFAITGPGGITINCITGPGNVLTTIQVGTKITLISQTLTSTTIKHNGVAVPGSARILLNGCVDFVMAKDDTLTLVYDGGAWNEVGRKECNDPIVALIDDVAALEACVFDASGGCYPEAWKTLDASGTMLNGEAIPTLNPTATNVISKRLRKLSKSHTELHIYATFTVADVIQIEAITTLPATALGISYRPTVDMNFPITGALSGGGGVWSGYINVSSGTGLVSVIVLDPTFVTDTDVDVSFCIQIPTD